MYPTIDIFGHTIGTYAICAAVGLFICAAVGYLLIREKKGVCIDDIIVTAVIIAVGMVIGGHIVFGITHIPDIINLFQHRSDYSFLGFCTQLFGVYLGGMVFYGGLLGGIAGLYITCRFTQF